MQCLNNRMKALRNIWFLILAAVYACAMSSCVEKPFNDGLRLRREVGAVSGGSVFLAVQSLGSWTLEVSYQGTRTGWLTVTPPAGTGNRNSVVVSYAENQDDDPRKAVITAHFRNGTQSVTFTQLGRSSMDDGGPGTILPPQGEFPQLESDVVPGWMELPAVKPGYGCAWIYHDMTFKGSPFRNYSIYYDASNMMAHWVAYPLNSALHGSGSRTDQWELKDPKIPYAYQPYTEKGWNVSGYDRGHMLPSADRVTDDAANGQTFYPTNMSVQIGSGFNQSIWADLEGRVRVWSDGCDTLYVVTGAVPSAGKFITDRAGNRVNVPEAYYKAVLEYKSTAPEARRYTGIAVYLEHKKYDKPSGTDPWKSTISANSMSISDLEDKVGINFFINLPEDYQKYAEETLNRSYWGL